jgi:hypothetical protein
MVLGMLIWTLCQSPLLEAGDAEFVKKPSGDQASVLFGTRNHPPLGKFILFCQVNATGRMGRCLFQGEARMKAYEVGALKLARYFQIAPTTKSGEPVAGRWIAIPIRLTSTGDEDNPGAGPDQSSASPTDPSSP